MIHPPTCNSPAHTEGRHHRQGSRASQQSSQARFSVMNIQNLWDAGPPFYLERQKAFALSTWAFSGTLACFPISDFRVRTPGLSSWLGGWSRVPRRFCRAMVIQGGAGWPSAAGGRPFSVGKDTRLCKTAQPLSSLTFSFSHTENTAQRSWRPWCVREKERGSGSFSGETIGFLEGTWFSHVKMHQRDDAPLV